MNEEQSAKWPDLQFSEIKDTLETLHQWIQIVGKIRLKTMPWQNHSWHTALYVTHQGFSTQAISYHGKMFQIDFDFKIHQLLISSSTSETVVVELKSRTVADFNKELFNKLEEIGVEVEIHWVPNE
jgi:hypothetical protein